MYVQDVVRAVFRAIHEGKWLDVVYCNRFGERTHFWAEITAVDPAQMTFRASGLHLSTHSLTEGMTLHAHKIAAATVIEGTWCTVNDELVADMARDAPRYEPLFGQVANMRVLNYYEDCHRLDADPYCMAYELLRGLDADSFSDRRCALTNEQFSGLMGDLLREVPGRPMHEGTPLRLRSLAMNALSVNTDKGLYVLAYRRLQLDVKSRELVMEESPTICWKFILEKNTADKTHKPVRLVRGIDLFLDHDEQSLLLDFNANAELIKDCITAASRRLSSRSHTARPPEMIGPYKVDDLPYVMVVGRDSSVNLAHEYSGILQQYNTAVSATPSAPTPAAQGAPATPIRAFFGELLKQPPAQRDPLPLVVLDNQAGLDQLRAIHSALNNPLTYVQGPPGTGKTKTIVNTVISAFCNNLSVLVSSYNNLPVKNVTDALLSRVFQSQPIHFPVLRIGNPHVLAESLDRVAKSLKAVRLADASPAPQGPAPLSPSSMPLEPNSSLLELLRRHEELVDLLERRDAVMQMLDSISDFKLHMDLQALQLNDINARIAAIGAIEDADAAAFLGTSSGPLEEYLFHESLRRYRLLDEPPFQEFAAIFLQENSNNRNRAFNRWISDDDNLALSLKVFPVVASTCLSASRLASPRPCFDLAIIDEASQCKAAESLIPVVRAHRLMLVGDPQQLSPITQLNESDNAALRMKYAVPKEYDYARNSVYQVFLACDSVSDEILLKDHYRCDADIIGFSNKKYYGGRLVVKTPPSTGTSLHFIDVRDNETVGKNTAPAEVNAVISYAQKNPHKNIGVITPFKNQRLLLDAAITNHRLTNVSCGTVHSFQGDEKDVVLLSLALTRQTHKATYEWLCNNRELINVATTRARRELVLVASRADIERLHEHRSDDDLLELMHYVTQRGNTEVTSRTARSRALGIKPYSTATEEAFLTSIGHAISTLSSSGRRHSVKREVPISHVFTSNSGTSADAETHRGLFYSGRFDFVVYERHPGSAEMPVLAFELDGREHFDEATVKQRDEEKNALCRAYGLKLVRVDNTYARRYAYLKDLLLAWLDVS
ncbi:MAG: AAA family ATPase [Coriobacteriales bacterium]|jgi:hypothetical protein|nr:AAA family ATPase [Coriobacteriales bacterium]